MIALIPSFSPLPEEISINTEEIYVSGGRHSPLGSLHPDWPFFRQRPRMQWRTRPIQTVPEPLSNGDRLLDTWHEFLEVSPHQHASLTLCVGTSLFIFSSFCQWSLTWLLPFFFENYFSVCLSPLSLGATISLASLFWSISEGPPWILFSTHVSARQCISLLLQLLLSPPMSLQMATGPPSWPPLWTASWPGAWH